MKIILIGANHAGTSFIRTLKTINPKIEITAYDANTNTSFLGCGIAIWASDYIKEPKGLFYSSPEILKKTYGTNLITNCEVTNIDLKNKQVTVRDNSTGSTFNDNYDKLVFAGGTWPIEIPIKGTNYKNVVIVKLYQHAQSLVKLINNPKIKNVTVIGAGYIGLELAEAFNKKGKKVVLVDINKRVANNYFDKEFTDIMEKNMVAQGVTLALNEKVIEIKSKDNINASSVLTDKNEYQTDLVITCIGFKPRTDIIDVEKTSNGAILVNEYQQSVSNSDVYALGDSCALKNSITGQPHHVALATNAVKTGIVAALNICESNISFPGIVGTNAINVFDCHYASTGLSLTVAKQNGFPNAKEIYFEDMDRPEFIKTAEKVACKIIYDADSLRLLGAQIGSWGSTIHTESIFMLALALQKKLTLPEIALTDFYFLPHFNKPFNFILVPIIKALGIDYKK